MRRNKTKRASGSAEGAWSVNPTGLPPDTLACLADSLAHRWKCYCKYLRQCQNKDSERAVHDLRVEARRLLALLSLCASFLAANRLAKIQAGLQCHLDVFDDLRDTQVQRALVRKLRSRYDSAKAFYRFLKKCESWLYRRTRKRARKLREKPLARLMDDCQESVLAWSGKHGSRAANAAVLRTVLRAYREASGCRSRIEPGDPHSIHCTRIAFKKFRYMVESLAEQLRWADGRLVEKMRRYQRMMGEIQDAQVLWRAFDKFARKKKPDSAAGARFERVLERRRDRRIASFMRVADQLREFEPPRRERAHAGRSARRARLKPRRISKSVADAPDKTTT